MNVIAQTDAPTHERKRPENDEWDAVAHDSEELLDVLGDEYTIAALREVLDEPLPVSTVAERTTMSRTTAFRRLDQLEDLGFVEVTRRSDGNTGLHHYNAYYATADRIAVEFTGNGFQIELAQETVEERTAANARSSAAD